MKDEWGLFQLEHENGEIWIIRKNFYPLPEGKSEQDFPICIYFSVRYQPSTDNGFPSSDDLDALEDIEAILVELCDGRYSTFVNTVFMPQLKDFIIYTSEPDKLGSTLQSKLSSFNQFNFEFGGSEDLEWSQYKSFE